MVKAAKCVVSIYKLPLPTNVKIKDYHQSEIAQSFSGYVQHHTITRRQTHTLTQ